MTVLAVMASRVADLAALLAQGDETVALPSLRHFLVAGSPDERLFAAWTLAQWYAQCGAWEKVHGILTPFRTQPNAIHRWPDPQPWLMAVQFPLQIRNTVVAQQILATIGRRAAFRNHPGLAIAALLRAASYGADDWELCPLLWRLHGSLALAALSLAAGQGSRFDRLAAAATLPATQRDAAPMVSVIVPLAEGALDRKVAKALAGLAHQSWRNLEILVIGGTRSAAARDWAARDGRVRLLPPVGAHDAFNAGLEQACGSFVTAEGADGWSHPFRIEAQLTPLLHDDRRVASQVGSLALAEDLGKARWHSGGWVAPEPSSLLFRTRLRESLGYRDRVTSGAEAEYVERIDAVHGAAALALVQPGVALRFCRDDAVPTPVDRSYLEAARYWHDTGAQKDALFMPRLPGRRLFAVPRALACDPPPLEQSAFDIVSALRPFDAPWYLRRHPGAARTGLGAVRHYLRHGVAEGLDPGPTFAAGAYCRAHGLAAGNNPLLHWHAQGRSTDGATMPQFPGALAGGDRAQERVLVCADAADAACLVPVLDRLRQERKAPVVAVFRLRPETPLAEVLRRCLAVEAPVSLPRLPLFPPASHAVKLLEKLMADYDCKTVHSIGAAHDAPLAAARLRGCEVVVHLPDLPPDDRALRDTLLASASAFRLASTRIGDWLGAAENVEIVTPAALSTLLSLPFEPAQTLRVGWLDQPTPEGLAALREHLSGRGGRVALLEEKTEVAACDVMLVTDPAPRPDRMREIMAAGRVPVCPDTEPLRALVLRGETGLLLVAPKPSAFAEAILALDAARGQLPALSEACRRRAEWLSFCASQESCAQG